MISRLEILQELILAVQHLNGLNAILTASTGYYLMVLTLGTRSIMRLTILHIPSPSRPAWSSGEVPPFFGPGVMRVWIGLRVMVCIAGCAAAGA